MDSHAFSVYFPIGLLTASVVFDVSAMATHRDELATAGWWTLVAGIFFAVIATVTGLLGNSSVELASPAGRSAVDIHGALAYVSLILFGILGVWRLFGHGTINERWVPAYLAAAVIAASLLLATSYVGMRSVYVHAVGISNATLESALGVRGTLPGAGARPPAEASPGAGAEPEERLPMDSAALPADTAAEMRPLPREAERVDTVST